MQDYRKLDVWHKSHKLTLDTYAVSPYFKAPEAWPVRDQMLRAAISIPSNIAPLKHRRRCRPGLKSRLSAISVPFLGFLQ